MQGITTRPTIHGRVLLALGVWMVTKLYDIIFYCADQFCCYGARKVIMVQDYHDLWLIMAYTPYCCSFATTYTVNFILGEVNACSSAAFCEAANFSRTSTVARRGGRRRGGRRRAGGHFSIDLSCTDPGGHFSGPVGKPRNQPWKRQRQASRQEWRATLVVFLNVLVA